VNTPKNKEDAPATESGIKRRKRTREKLIRLKGGRQLPFGVTDTTQRETNPNK
jgi:hypothetical protein